jgi:hypothetical protein
MLTVLLKPAIAVRFETLLQASKEVMASLMNKKEDFLPKCFSKCCSP